MDSESLFWAISAAPIVLAYLVWYLWSNFLDY